MLKSIYRLSTFQIGRLIFPNSTILSFEINVNNAFTWKTEVKKQADPFEKHCNWLSWFLNVFMHYLAKTYQSIEYLLFRMCMLCHISFRMHILRSIWRFPYPITLFSKLTIDTQGIFLLTMEHDCVDCIVFGFQLLYIVQSHRWDGQPYILFK